MGPLGSDGGRLYHDTGGGHAAQTRNLVVGAPGANCER